MGGGYKTPPGDSQRATADRFKALRRQVRESQQPTGTQRANLLEQVQAAIANLTAGVASAAAAWMAANAYTKAQVDSLVASPGAIAPTDVNASGQVTSAQPLKSPGSYAYTVTTGYVAAWINNDGQIGFSPSTAAVKKDLQSFPDDLANAFLSLTPYLGRYEWDDESDPLKVFLLAEDTQTAGFGPDVVPVDEAGQPTAINYSQLIVPALAVMRKQQAEIDALKAQVEALGGGA